jgi:hypothetical protein
MSIDDQGLNFRNSGTNAADQFVSAEGRFFLLTETRTASAASGSSEKKANCWS